MNLEVLYAVGVGLLFVAAFVGLGGLMLRRIGIVTHAGDSLRLLPVAAALGFAVLSYVAYIVVAVRAGPLVVLVLLAAGVLAGYRYWSNLAIDISTAARWHRRTLMSPIAMMFIILSVGFLLIVSTHWLTPPREGDALRGYMFTARWLHDRGLIYSPYNTVYQLYPFNTELVYAVALAFGNDIIPKVIDGVMGLCLLGVIYEFARRYTEPLFSFMAAASLAVMSAFAGIWGVGKIDVFATLTFVAGTSLLFRHLARPSWKTLAAAAFLVGTSCAEKYTVWVFGAAFVLAIVILTPGPATIRVRQALAAAVVIFCCLLPHFGKTVAWTGNPVAPFATSIFPTTGVDLDPHDFSDALSVSSTSLAALPSKLFFDASESRVPGPFPLLILIGLPFCVMRSVSPYVRRLAVFAALLVVAWIAVRQGHWLEPRFLLAPTSLLLVVAAASVGQAAARSNMVRWALTALTAFVIAYSGIWQNRDWRRSWPFILGYEDRAAWYDRIAPARGYGALTSLASELSSNRRMLIWASIYYIPDDKLQYISTERELAQYVSLPPEQQLAFLQQHCFGYLHYLGNNPPWTSTLPVVAQWRDKGHGLEFTVFRVDTSCERAPAGERSHPDPS
jgi:hypothetical protein